MKVYDKLKIQIKKIPGINNLENRIQLLERELKDSRYNSVQIGCQAVDYRLRLKKMNNEKINVVFVCHRPAVWESLHSVYDALKADADFNVNIVAIPNKKELPKLGLNHETYETEGAEEFWKDYGCINGYDYRTKEWFDLRTLKPDYVFFQQPYNMTRCEAYKSWNVAQYAKICYLNYFGAIGVDEIYEECLPIDFLQDCSYYFTQNKNDNDFIIEYFKKFRNITNIIMTGYPKYESVVYKKYIASNLWNTKLKGYRIVWTPRWTTNEGNCHFFDYKDRFIDYCNKNEKKVDLVFRPHPQAFSEWESTGEFTKSQADEYRSIYETTENMHIDTSSEYLSLITSSDCLISDHSSLILEYFLTGKPIIFCPGKANNLEESPFKLLMNGFYIAESWDKIENILVDLRNGNDYLYKKRQELLKEVFYLPKESASEQIKNIIKANADKVIG